jgi:5-methylcytosine-specific restriction endonuclease McrA
MARCTRTTNLEVHHKRKDGGNKIDNAMVLCQPCHAKTDSYGKPGDSPADFPEDVKEQAKRNAGYRCECTSDYRGCH